MPDQAEKFLTSCCLIFAIVFLFLPFSASAHEIYVLNQTEISQGFQYAGFETFYSLENAENLKIALEVFFAVLILLGVNLIFRHSSSGRRFNDYLSKFSRFGPLIVRLAISLSFFYSALTWSFLGPDIFLENLAFPGILRLCLFTVSILIFLGLFTELAAFIAFLVYLLAAARYGFYLINYLNYLGEIIVLTLLGSRYLSWDKIIFGAKKKFQNLKQYESTIVRVCYGIALSFAAIYIKFLHPRLTELVVLKYNLTQFHWLFPSDPQLVVFGAGLVELVIGLFIIFGFELRLTVFVSLLYLTLSILFFREAVWPHFMIYGISLNLLFDQERFTFDHFLDKIIKKPTF